MCSDNRDRPNILPVSGNLYRTQEIETKPGAAGGVRGFKDINNRVFIAQCLWFESDYTVLLHKNNFLKVTIITNDYFPQ